MKYRVLNVEGQTLWILEASSEEEARSLVKATGNPAVCGVEAVPEPSAILPTVGLVLGLTTFCGSLILAADWRWAAIMATAALVCTHWSLKSVPKSPPKARKGDLYRALDKGDVELFRFTTTKFKREALAHAVFRDPRVRSIEETYSPPEDGVN